MKYKVATALVFCASFEFANADVLKCAKVALYVERDAINKATLYSAGMNIDKNGIIQSPGTTWASSYSNTEKATTVVFKDKTRIVFEKSADRKINKVTSDKTTSTLTEHCELDQRISDGKEVLYDRKACLELANLYRRWGISTQDLFTCGSVINGVTQLIEGRNQEMKGSGLAISPITNKNPLEVGGFVYSCADQLSFEQIAAGVVKGTMYPFTRRWLDRIFLASPGHERPKDRQSADK